MLQTCKNIALREYQVGVTKWMLDHPEQKGILIRFGVGTGKTLAATNIINAMKVNGRIDVAFVLTPKSIVAGFKQDVSKCSGAEGKKARLPKHIYVYSHTDTKKIKAAWDKLRDKRKMLVVDEVHNLRTQLDRPNKKGDRTTQVYQFIDQLAKESEKIIHLSATPMVNHPRDIVLPMNMFLPRKLPLGKQFDRKYINDENNSIKNRQELGQRIMNHIAYYDADDSDFPKTDVKVINVPLDRKQMDKIEELGRKNNIDFGRHPSRRPSVRDQEQKKGNLNAFLNRSRQYSISVGQMCSSKIKEIIKLVKKGPGPTIIYSFYVQHGVDVIHDCLAQSGIPVGRMMKITSNVSAKKRKEWMAAFNRNEIDVVLISKSGSEGINFSGARQVIIAAPDWNMANVKQAVGRATRMTSKVKVVKVFVMLGVSPRMEESPDQRLWKFSKNKQELIDLFDDMMSDYAVDLEVDDMDRLMADQKEAEQQVIDATVPGRKKKARTPKAKSPKNKKKKKKGSGARSPRSPRTKRGRSPRKPRSECAKKSIAACDSSPGCSARRGYCRRKRGAPANVSCGKKSPLNCRNSRWCSPVKAGCRKTKAGKQDVSSDDLPLQSLYY